MNLRHLVYDLLPMAFVALAAFFLYGFALKLVYADMEKGQARYELCINSGGQWVSGSCVR